MAKDKEEAVHTYSRGPAATHAQDNDAPTPAPLPASGMTVAQEHSIAASAVRDDMAKVAGLVEELQGCVAHLSERLRQL